jgi:hypothetical protein
MLIEHGADVHAVDSSDRTALLIASTYTRDHNLVECMQILIEAKSDVNASNSGGNTAAHYGSRRGNIKCLQLLIDNHADVHARTNCGESLSMYACEWRNLPILQLLLDNKADLSVRDYENQDALYMAIGRRLVCLALPFAVLCCNTDVRNGRIDEDDGEAHYDEDEYAVTVAKVAACIEEYTHIQAYIDEFHRTLELELSEHVPVDPRFGLGQMGIYQEPLERTLEYLGLSMNKDQVVNASIDEDTKRALIPFHVLDAEVWYNKYQAR